ncbi:MAG: HDIG domain-containing metalloprotein [Patescibacteria group bacterium]
MPNREDTYKLMSEWVQSDSLRKHMLCVEAAMRAYAQKYGADAETWGNCGLIHDFDYERYPTYDSAAKSGHPYEGVKVLQAAGYPAEIIEAILGHAQYTGVAREGQLAKCLFACDELCGFLVACAYMRPDRFASMDASTVKKKLKDKKFAAKVSRADIEQGIAELGPDRDEHIDFVIAALRPLENQLFA